MWLCYVLQALLGGLAGERHGGARDHQAAWAARPATVPPPCSAAMPRSRCATTMEPSTSHRAATRRIKLLRTTCQPGACRRLQALALPPCQNMCDDDSCLITPYAALLNGQSMCSDVRLQGSIAFGMLCVLAAGSRQQTCGIMLEGTSDVPGFAALQAKLHHCQARLAGAPPLRLRIRGFRVCRRWSPVPGCLGGAC